MGADKPRWQQLREQAEGVSTTELDDLWTRLRPARAEEILGSWRGDAFQTGHSLCRVLPASRWHGKDFLALDDAKPLICRAEDGTLFSNVELGQGEATLWNIEFRGEVTATMVYDGRAVFDHFKWLDSTTLMGIMNGRAELVLSRGEHFYFLLERVS
ncbi:DUF4334 domain-containing protein [Nocardia mangyaensis]|uniref:DUF4334 domain-containing protein n=1 Tax=Nocardia mangyaensis TaxID=2213200 RepID=UPI002676BC97|nr:DUF4334 domain-containing protein [Nocardia mangyaensis]MDO3646318.1 DUF4334 domain-containing protein [Nocardia mangyaensis]